MVCPPDESQDGTVAQLDGLREDLAYLRLLLGIVIVAEISLCGWMASAPDTTTPRLFALAVGGMMVLGIGIYVLHRQIKRRIEAIRSL
jgi:hypothetical protein